MKKWEYCLAFQHAPNEVWVWGPDGEAEKLKGDWNFLTAISELGARGWEAVNYDPMKVEASSFRLYTIQGHREILFKRPSED